MEVDVYLMNSLHTLELILRDIKFEEKKFSTIRPFGTVQKYEGSCTQCTVHMGHIWSHTKILPTKVPTFLGRCQNMMKGIPFFFISSCVTIPKLLVIFKKRIFKFPGIGLLQIKKNIFVI